MKYERFEQLPAWNAAIELAVLVYALTGREAFRGQYSLRDQIERAAVSISNNIAEGFERGSNQELVNFLYIARGSAGEVRSMLSLLGKIPAFSCLDSERSALQAKAESVSRQLGAWIRSLRDSDFQGERLIDRKAERIARERREFEEELERARRGNNSDSKFKTQDDK